MINKIYFRFISLVILSISILSCEHQPDLNKYRWILGTWDVKKNHTEIIEIWKPISDTLYEGFNYSISEENDTTINEHLWMESRDNKVILSAVVFGHNNDERIFFTLTKKNKSFARFENKEHHFPNIIEYKNIGRHYLEVHQKNETKTLPAIKMHKINN